MTAVNVLYNLAGAATGGSWMTRAKYTDVLFDLITCELSTEERRKQVQAPAVSVLWLIARRLTGHQQTEWLLLEALPALWGRLSELSLSSVSAKSAGCLLDVLSVNVRFLEARMDERGSDDWKFRAACDVLFSLAGGRDSTLWSVDGYADSAFNRPAALAAFGTLVLGTVFHGRTAQQLPPFADPTYLCLALGADLVAAPELVACVDKRPAQKMLGRRPTTPEEETPRGWEPGEVAYTSAGLRSLRAFINARFEEVALRICKNTRLVVLLEAACWGEPLPRVVLTFLACAPLDLLMGASSADRTPDARHWSSHLPLLANALSCALQWLASKDETLQQRAAAVLAARLASSARETRVQGLVSKLLPTLAPSAQRYEPKEACMAMESLLHESNECFVFETNNSQTSKSVPLMLIRYMPKQRSQYDFDSLSVVQTSGGARSTTVKVGDVVSTAPLELLVEYLALGKVRTPVRPSHHSGQRRGVQAPPTPTPNLCLCVHALHAASPAPGHAERTGAPPAPRARSKVQGTTAAGRCVASGRRPPAGS